MTKEQRTIKALKEEIAKLTDKLDSVTSSYNYANNERNELRKELNDLHSTFDLLSVPRKPNTDTYSSDLSANARMTLFLANNICGLNKSKSSEPLDF